MNNPTGYRCTTTGRGIWHISQITINELNNTNSPATAINDRPLCGSNPTVILGDVDHLLKTTLTDALTRMSLIHEYAKCTRCLVKAQPNHTLP